MIQLVKELCALNGVSSFEDEVRERIVALVKPCADSLRVDAMGNLIVFKRGKKPAGNRLMLAAHMDEVGLIVREITEEGYLGFDFVGGVDRRVAIGKQVFVGPDRIPGVIGIKAIHLVKAKERGTVPKTQELYIDIGARDKEAAQAKVALGEYAAFSPECVEFGSGFLKAKAIDDRIGCAVMVRLLQEELPIDCTFAFTVQEEVGTRGAFGAAFSVTPEIALVLEGTTAADCANTPEHKRVCSPGKGPVIPFMDGGTIYDRGLYQLLTGLCEKEGIPWQTKEYISGGTDARTIQRTKEGVRVAAVSAAVRYLHSPSSVAATADFEHILQLSRAFLHAVAAGC
jgi:endoglucanase